LHWTTVFSYSRAFTDTKVGQTTTDADALRHTQVSPANNLSNGISLALILIVFVLTDRWWTKWLPVFAMVHCSFESKSTALLPIAYQ
jgi:hypothetical protein